MSTNTSTTAGHSAPVSRPRIHVSQWNVMRSEWVKLRSVRSTGWSLLTAVTLTIGFGLIACFAAGNRPSDASFDPVSRSLVGANVAVLAFGVLGVLCAAGEYSTGMIRSSMMAVPKRLPVLWGKAIVFAVTTLIVALVLVLVAFFLGQAILSGKHLSTSFSAAGVPRTVLGTALYMAMSGVFALALGAIVRNSAAGITGFVAILFVIPLILALISSWVSDHVVKFLPFQAGGSITNLTRQSHTLAPWPGVLVFAAWIVILLAIAAVMMVKRDV